MTSKEIMSMKIGVLQNKSQWLKAKLAWKLIVWNNKKNID